MENFKSLSCPISGVKVNENVVRTISLLVLVLTTLSIYFNYYFITLFLIFDFASRAFLNKNYSVLKLVSIKANKLLSLAPVLVDEAPKKFAAQMGFAFVNIIFVLQYFDFTSTAQYFGVLLIICAILESFFAFCVGCLIYQLIKK